MDALCHNHMNFRMACAGIPGQGRDFGFSTSMAAEWNPGQVSTTRLAGDSQGNRTSGKINRKSAPGTYIRAVPGTGVPGDMPGMSL